MTNAGNFHFAVQDDREIVIVREFEAPRALVWRSMTDPEHLKRWLCGPPGWKMGESSNDLRDGGAFRWVWRDPENMEMSLVGRNLEVVAPGRVRATQRFDYGGGTQADSYESLLELSEDGPRTQMRLTLTYADQAARDAAVSGGMAQGMAAGYQRLAELLARETK